MKRALRLFESGMVEEREYANGKKKFAVRKSHNLNTGTHSKFLTEFSATGWNQTTIDFLDAIMALGDKRLKHTLDEASDRAKQGQR